MEQRLETFKNDFLETLLNWLWGSWALLGVPGSVKAQDLWAMDPEALLLFSLPIARHDPRLFDEILNWLKTNGKLINVQRLRKMAIEENYSSASLLPILGDIFSARQQPLKWKNLRSPEESLTGTPLFLTRNSDPLPLFGDLDPTFKKSGWLRGKWEFREHTATLPLHGTAGALLRLRAFFGMGARAEIMLYLFTHDQGGHPSRIASETGYSQKTVQDTLVDMTQSGLIRVTTAGNRKDYHLRPQDFGNIPHLLGIPPRWINWSVLLAVLEKIFMTLSRKDFLSLPPILAASELRTLMEKIQPKLEKAEVPKFFSNPSKNYPGEKYLETFTSDLNRLLKEVFKL